MKKVVLTVMICVSLIFTSAAFAALPGDFLPDGVKAQNTDPSTEKRIQAKLPGLRLPFIKNENQTDKSVKYYAKTFAGTVFVSDEEITYDLPGSENTEKKGWVIKEKLIHVQKIKALGKGETETRVNYVKEKDPGKWRRNVPTFRSVHLGEVYKDIELELRAYGNNVEKVFTVGRGADPETIRIQVQGVDSLQVNDKGELEMETGLGKVRMTAPVAHQEIGGKTVNVSASYSMKGRRNIHEYGFTLGA